MNDTTRRYPRTLDEAFKGASYAGSIHTPDRRIVGFHALYLDRPITARCARAIMRAFRWVRGL
jgi:hypothetical protein